MGNRPISCAEAMYVEASVRSWAAASSLGPSTAALAWSWAVTPVTGSNMPPAVGLSSSAFRTATSSGEIFGSEFFVSVSLFPAISMLCPMPRVKSASWKLDVTRSDVHDWNCWAEDPSHATWSDFSFSLSAAS
ncbi:hypothetical protein [Yinghuangia sp. YIM S09857]|uniref:hypothetical protein n=1 Tax=Yinghuangia sp. YIM S09857 TaxID=3436929 RepID=UPI003F52B7A9